MTDILCRWLNDELHISQRIDPATFARDFSSGYLIGEVLHKYHMQNDFDQFSQSRTTDSKLNNFTRLEPIFTQLGVDFDTSIARDVMTEKHGIATRLLYELYIALNNKKRSNASSSATDTQQQTQQLKTVTSRKSVYDLTDVTAKMQDHQANMGKLSFPERFMKHEKRLLDREQQHQENLDKMQMMQAKRSELVAKIKTSSVHVPKPPSKFRKAQQEKNIQRRKKETANTIDAIARFEDKLKMILLPTDDGGDEIDISYILKRDEERADTLNVVKMSSNMEYIGKIHKRLQEDAAAREEREKRRRKVIGEQMSAHQAQEEARREEMMVNKLMRQSQQERRIAVQLLQARHEKEVIRNNRITKEQQYQERRLHEFEDAFNREAELAHLRKEECKEEIQQQLELHKSIAAQKAEERYRNHYDSCFDIIAQVVDFSCKVAEYRQLTENLIPAKLMRDWTAMFVSGYPLYEAAPAETGEPTPEQILEEERQMLLDEGDFMEYKNMIGEWQPPEVTEIDGPPRSNPVVGHIIQRLYNIVHPPTPPPPPPEFPPFPVRACVLGKPFAGKTTVVKQLLEDHRLVMFDADELVNEAVEAHKNNELIEVVPEDVVRQSSTTDAPSGTNQDGESQGEATAVAPAESGSAEESTEKQPGSEKSSANQLLHQESKENSLIKPSSVQRSRDRNKDSNEPQPSLRNKLGSKALKFLKKGRPVDDQIVVDIVTDAIKRVPEGSGWVIDGYPQNYNQAKLLEKALSGYDANARENVKPPVKTKSRRSSLAPDPRPTPPPSEPASGIDVIIYFDIEDEECIKRASGNSKSAEGEEQCNEEGNPPPEGSTTGSSKQEKVNPGTDSSNDQDQLQQRITTFQDTWPKLDKWFTRFGTLKKVDAGDEPKAVFLEVEKILEDTVAKNLGKDLESSLPLEPTEPQAEKVEESPETIGGVPGDVTQEPPKETPAEGKTSRPGSKTGSHAGSTKRPASRSSSKGEVKKDEAQEKSDSPKRENSAKRSDGSRRSRVSSARSAKEGMKVSTKRDRSPEPELEVDVPAAPATPQPGDEEWEFVDLEVDQVLADILSTQWEGVEKTYVANCKHVFRQVRQERENIYRYFFQIRKDFLSYLRRPDCKQDFVARWQKDYNAVPNDMREDDETRAELHQRVDDLREQLWHMCDDRKENAEKERESVMTDGWLDDRLGILSNHYITLMQADLDRFQDTVRLLKDYYKGMDGHIPDGLNTDYERMPLIELPVEKVEILDKQEEADLGNNVPSDETAPAHPAPDSSRGQSKSPRDDAKSTRTDTKASKPSSKNKNHHDSKDNPDEAAIVDGAGLRIKIPLIPRFSGPGSQDRGQQSATSRRDKKVAKKSGAEDTVTSAESASVAPQDPDERLLFDAHLFAISGIAQIMMDEMAVKEAEENQERMAQLEKEKIKQGKGKKKGSPASKKGAAPPSPLMSEEESEEEKLKNQIKLKMRHEYYFTIKEEDTAARIRLEVVKAISMAVIQDLKSKADNAFKDINDWLGARFLKEMESIDTMSEVMRQAIEEGRPVKEQIVLQQDDFLMDSDYFVLKTPTPLPVPEAGEETMPDHFTVNQLFKLFKQFTAVAPSSILSLKVFGEVLDKICSTTSGMEQLPDRWLQVHPSQIVEIGRMLALETDYLDWRRFMLALLWPIPTPTQAQLLSTLQRFKDMDQKNIGFVTREQFDRTALWFDTFSPYHDSFDRLTSLKKILFDIFADHTGSLSKLDYVSMLLYFSAVPNSYEGFLRALSVASNCHMPHLPKPVMKISDSSICETSDHSLTENVSLDSVETAEPPTTGEAIPPEAIDNLVPIDALMKVLQQNEIPSGESSRFGVSSKLGDKTSKVRLQALYEELGADPDNLAPLPFKTLLDHYMVQEFVVSIKTFQSLDMDCIFNSHRETATLEACS